ncbi:ribonuclease H [Trifolium pratense]|uniref:Ribonuclease H n=1 Tax=Trifolium pratense TaxID=57577 RepID=A0A2K3P6E9_TRIPR|nr:ribonuclease H [Trifolium pratense]
MGLAHRMCEHCREIEETGLHVLRDCDLAKKTWLTVVPQNLRADFFGGDLVHWFKFNVHGEIAKIADMDWTVFWANACYSLWIWRNKEKHKDNFMRPLQPVQFREVEMDVDSTAVVKVIKDGVTNH